MRRKNYKKIWERHHNKPLPENMEIHHIDGNFNNNDPSNLLAVTIEEHLKIHLDQNDYSAVQAILMRMKRTDENISLLRKAASEHQKKLVEEGKHNFQNEENRLKQKESIKKLHEQRKEDGQGSFLGIKDTIENSRYAGKRAAELNAGFLDTNSPNHGSKHVKGTKWWTHISGERIRSKECPGDNWKQGMKYESTTN